MDHDVGFFDEAVNDLASRRCLEVDRNALFALYGLESDGSRRPHRVACQGFELDDQYDDVLLKV